MTQIPIEKLSDDKFKVAVATTMYAKEAITSACYKFTDKFYVFQQESTAENTIEIIFETKDGNVATENTVKEFCNELIDQQVRFNINKQFGHIRDLIVEEAFKPIKG